MTGQHPYKFSTEEFNFIADLVRKNSGINLTADKEYLVASRLEPIITCKGANTAHEILHELRTNPNSPLVSEIVDAMTTGETLFFRDSKLFTQLHDKLLPELKANAKERGKLRIWSAAASTGQEAYSLAMILKGDASTAPFHYEIIATDINQKVLDKAQKGIYTNFEIQRGITEDLLHKHFTKLPENNWQIKEELRNNITFCKHNLLHDFSNKGLFDIILCRNVLIYFNDATKQDIISRLQKSLHPNGILVLGGSEFINKELHELKNLEGIPGVYQ